MTGPRLFPLQEIGSLAKPRWQLMGQRGEPLDSLALRELEQWQSQTHFVPPDDPRIIELRAGHSRELGPEAVRDLGALFGLRFFESIGLDRVYDGEARRMEMYEYPIRQMSGFQFLGHVRSFDNKYYLKAAVTGEVGLDRPYHLEEFDFVRANSHATPKIPVTGPYTLADWSYNEYYLGRQRGWKGRAAHRSAQREFVVELARRALRPTLKALIDRGARLIQIDEPAAGTHPEEAELVVEGFNAATEGLDAEFSMHICYSDYATLFPALLEARRCDQWAWEFANRDGDGRDGYAVLQTLNEYKDERQVGLGVVDVHRDEVESPALVRDRILRAVRILGDPGRIWVNPDCGLRTRRLDIAWAKLKSAADGARLARESLTGRAS